MRSGTKRRRAEATPDPAPKRIVVAYGFWIFILSDIVMFSALFASLRVLVRATAGGPVGAELFSQVTPRDSNRFPSRFKLHVRTDVVGHQFATPYRNICPRRDHVRARDGIPRSRDPRVRRHDLPRRDPATQRIKLYGLRTMEGRVADLLLQRPGQEPGGGGDCPRRARRRRLARRLLRRRDDQAPTGSRTGQCAPASCTTTPRRRSTGSSPASQSSYEASASWAAPAFLGRALVDAALARGHEVTLLQPRADESRPVSRPRAPRSATARATSRRFEAGTFDAVVDTLWLSAARDVAGLVPTRSAGCRPVLLRLERVRLRATSAVPDDEDGSLAPGRRDLPTRSRRRLRSR